MGGNDAANFGLDLTGKTLAGRYRLDSVLGKGGMGTVYLATDVNLSRQVVVKVPHPKFLSGAEFAGRFEKEIKNLIALEHPSLVKVVDAGTSGEVPFAVLQYLPGGNLEKVLAERAGRLTPADVLQWLPKVAAALDVVHKSGVVHRGVKPQNVLFDKEGNAFLADFGVVKVLGEKEANATLTGASPGSSEYMAPEAATSSTLTPAFDQYGLAVIAYQALAGKLPYHGQTGLASMVVKQVKPAQPLSETAPQVPAPVAAAVMKALEREPAKRFPTCSSFAQAFTAGAQAAATSSPPAPPPPPPAAPVKSGGESETRVIQRDDPTKQRQKMPAVPPPPAAAVPPPPPVVASKAPTAQVNVAAAAFDPNATRMVSRAGMGKKAAEPAVALPKGAAPRKAGSSKKLLVILGVVVVVGVAAVVAMQGGGKEASVTLEITSPQKDQMLFTPDVMLRGTFASPRPTDKVKVGGVEVMVADGKFERMLTLTTEGTQTIEVTVESKDGKPLGTFERRVTYRAMWRPLVDDAKQAASKGDWTTAKAKIAEAKAKGAAEKDLPEDVVTGIATWEAPPALTIETPAEGAVLEKDRVDVKGTFSSGRAADRLKVDGEEVKATEGKFATTVSLPEGEKEIVISVEDGPAVRKRMSIHVKYKRPPEPWEGWLAGWATVGDLRRDAITGFPLRILRTKDGGEMVLIPGGSFPMGAGPKSKTVLDDEKPGHSVTLAKAFYMDANEVSVAQWKKFSAAGEGPMPNLGVPGTKDEMPVYNVTHDEAAAFARWAGTNLPTEAQWERAARGGHDDWEFPWGMEDDESKRNGVGAADGFERLAPVRSFLPNGYGLFDMAGNVWEWCSDWYDAKYYVTSTPNDPTGPATGTLRSLRGGGWNKGGVTFRVIQRNGYAPDRRYDHVGLRCVKSLP